MFKEKIIKKSLSDNNWVKLLILGQPESKKEVLRPKKKYKIQIPGLVPVEYESA